jgi:hypothetical protein
MNGCAGCTCHGSGGSPPSPAPRTLEWELVLSSDPMVAEWAAAQIAGLTVPSHLLERLRTAALNLSEPALHALAAHEGGQWVAKALASRIGSGDAADAALRIAGDLSSSLSESAADTLLDAIIRSYGHAHSSPASTRAAFVSAIGGFAHSSQVALNALLAFVRSDDPDAREAAAVALNRLELPPSAATELRAWKACINDANARHLIDFALLSTSRGHTEV